MKLNRSDVRRLLYRLGFLEAPNWNDDKLREVAREIPKRFSEDQIPKRYRDLYAKLCKIARTGEFIVWETIKPLEG